MPAAEVLPDRDEIARLGEAAYATRVRPTLTPADDGKYVAIDPASGDFEMDADDYAAVMRLRVRRPAGLFWLERVGYAAACQMRSGQ